MQTKVLSFFNFQNYASIKPGYHLLTDFKSGKFWWIYHTVLSGKWSHGCDTKEELAKAINAKTVAWIEPDGFISGEYHWAAAPDDWINGPPDKIYKWEDVLLVGKDATTYYHWSGGHVKASPPAYVKDVLEPELIADGFNYGPGDYQWNQFFQMVGWNSLHQAMSSLDTERWEGYSS
jgi:hypothetical protein